MRSQNEVLPDDVLIPYFGKETPLVGVEIGVGGGTGSYPMLARLPNLKLYCIDPWKHVDLSPYEAGLPQDIQDIGYAQAVSRLSQFGDRAVILRKRSDEAVDDIPNDLDFVHIDGHHEYDQVMRDIQNYLPKIRKGGLISGHDYPNVPDVVRAVDEVFGKNVSFGEDMLWWVYVQ
jgi:predicted O-methyltransferase YrrM